MKHGSSFEQAPKIPPTPFSFDEKLIIQEKLMAGYAGQTLDDAGMERISQEGFTDELFLEFTDKYAKKFSELITQKPELHQLFKEDETTFFEYISKHLGIESPTHH